MLFSRKRIYGINPDCDAARLSHIVAACNAYVARGQRISIILGHTPGSGYHQTLPLDVGAATPACNFMSDGLWIYADLETDPVFDEVVKRHPLVSVELFSDGVICPIAFMAGNRPAIEVGPLEFGPELAGVDLSKYAYTEEREGQHSTYTLDEDDDMGISAEAVRNLVSECLMSSEMAAQIKSLTDTVGQLQVQVSAHAETNEGLKWLFDESEEAEDEMEDGMDQELGDETISPEGDGAPGPEVDKEEMPTEEEGADEEAEPDVEKNDVGMAMPSGTNTNIPTTNTGKEPEEDKLKKKNYEELELEHQTYMLEAENNKKLAADYAARIEALGGDAEASNAHILEVERKYAMEKRKNDLLVLHDKYEFDVEKEMEIVGIMDDNQFEQHKKLVVVKYAAPPVHSPAVHVGELPKEEVVKSPYEKIIPKDVSAKVVKYALDHKMKFNEAYKEVMGAPPP